MLRLLPIVGALSASVVNAQLSISEANMTVTTGVVSASSNNPVTLDLVSDVLALDQAYEHWWYYRLAGDPRESALRAVGSFDEGVAATGRHADRTFHDVDARGVLKASLDFDVYSTGTSSGVVISRVSVMNISNAPITLDLFAYTDLDVAGTFADDHCTGHGTSHFVTDPSGVQIEVRGVDANRSMVGAYPQVRTLLANAAIDDLSNAVPPFTGDYTGAFQWTSIPLIPFQERSFQVVIAVDHPALAVPAIDHYGAANGSVMDIHVDELPLQDLAQPQTFAVRFRHAIPFAEYRIVTGLAPWDALPFIGGLDLWVDPFALIGVYAGFADATGEGREQFTIPSSPYVTGFSVFHQCFSVDPSAPNGFATFTPGVRTRIGKR